VIRIRGVYLVWLISFSLLAVCRICLLLNVALTRRLADAWRMES